MVITSLAPTKKLPFQVLFYLRNEAESVHIQSFMALFESCETFTAVEDAIKALKAKKYDILITEPVATCPEARDLLQAAQSKATRVEHVCSLWKPQRDINAKMWTLDHHFCFSFHGKEEDAMTVALYSMFAEQSHIKWFSHMQAECLGMRETLIREKKQTVLLTGAAGTGKYTLAHVAHIKSSRRYHEFVFANCKSMNKSKSMILGKAQRQHFLGVLREMAEQAQGGTLYLHEVDHLDISTQEVLVDFLTEELRVNTEKSSFKGVVICSTRVSLEDDIPGHICSKKLIQLFQHNVIRVGSILEYGDNAEKILEEILKNYCLSQDIPLKSFSTSAMNLLTKNVWNRNLREMFDVVRHAVYMTSGSVIKVNAIRTDIPVDPGDSEYDKRRKVKNALQKANGVVKNAATFLGITPKTLYAWLKELNMPLDYIKSLRAEAKRNTV